MCSIWVIMLGFPCFEPCWTPIDHGQLRIKDEGSNMRSNRRSKLWGPTKHHFTNNQIDWKVYPNTLWKAFTYISFTHTHTINTPYIQSLLSSSSQLITNSLSNLPHALMLLPTYPFLFEKYHLHYNLNKVIQSKLIHNLFKDLSRLLWLETFSLKNIQD